MTNKPAEKVALLIRGATVSDPIPTTTKEAVAQTNRTTRKTTIQSLQDLTSTTDTTTTDRDLRGDHMTTNRPLHKDIFVQGYYTEMYRLVSKRRDVPRHAVDDIVMFAVELLMEQIDFVVAQHPDPVVYARRQVTNKVLDYKRRIAAQRGEGARFTRTVGSYDLMTNPDASVPSNLDLAQDVVERDERERQMAIVRKAVGDENLELLEMIDGHDYSVTDVAKIRGQRRETVSRKHGALIKEAKKALGPAA